MVVVLAVGHLGTVDVGGKVEIPRTAWHSSQRSLRASHLPSGQHCESQCCRNRNIPGRLGSKEECETENDSRNHLQPPWNTECSGSVNEAAAIRDIEHDQNTPCDRPLLGTDDTTTFAGRSKFGNIHGDYA